MSNQLVVSLGAPYARIRDPGVFHLLSQSQQGRVSSQKCFVLLQGVVFDRVIQEVCDSSQIDFEEGGVDQQTLEDLRKVSLFHLATPWGPCSLDRDMREVWK